MARRKKVSVLVALTGLPIGYSVLVALTGLPIGYSVIIALTGLPIGCSVLVALTGLPIGYSVIIALISLRIGYSVINKSLCSEQTNSRSSRLEQTDSRRYQPVEEEQQSTVMTDGGSEEEQKVVDMITAPGGIRAAPARDQLDQFIKKFVMLCP